jgi:choline dehydrogenase
VLTNAHVTKLLFKSTATLFDEKMVDGIEIIDKDGNIRRLKALKEYILTAGAIGSPQILLQSGIGPKEDLEKLNIPVVSDLPVGKNLQNHVSVALKVFTL